jgi:putative oxidoreductase
MSFASTSRMFDPAAPAMRILKSVLRLFERIPDSLLALIARLSVASVFWASARTKVEEGTLFTLSDSAVYLFREEYRLPYLPPEIAAHLALFNEHAMPILLVLGLASRFAAAVLLTMTLVIQLFVYPDAYSVHGPWVVCLLYLMKYGPGALSSDHLIVKLRPRC